MKKLFTKLTAIIAVLLLSAWSANAAVHPISNGEIFECLQTNITTTPGSDWVTYTNATYASRTVCVAGNIPNLSSSSRAVVFNVSGCESFTIYGDGNAATRYLTYSINGGTPVQTAAWPNGCSNQTFSTGNTGNITISIAGVSGSVYLGKIVFFTPASPSITAFTAAGIAATISESTKTITAELPFGTNLTSITPTVTIGGTATGYTPTGAQDFSAGAVTYTATDGTNNVNYAVTLTASTTPSSDNDLSNVTIGGFTPVFISETNTYSVVLPSASILSQAVVFTKPVTATANFTSGDVHNFSSPLSITVTAQDATPKVFTLQATVGTKNIAYVTAAGNNDPYLRTSLISAGYYVEDVVAATQTASYFADHDLVILFDVVSSSNTLALNMKDLIGTKRFLNLKAFMYGKTGWPSGTGVNVVAERVANIQSNYVTHPIFTGLTLSDTEATLVEATVSGNGLQGVTTPGAGTVIASLKSNAAAACIIEDNTVESAMYLMIGYSNGATTALANINADGKKLLDNAVAYLLGNTKFIPMGTGFSTPTLNGVSFDGKIIRNGNRQELIVFNSTGRLLVRSTEDISMASQPKGVYFIKSSGGTIKIALTK